MDSEGVRTSSFLDRYSMPVVMSLVAIGVAERAAWNMLRPTDGAAGEAMRVATAIGEGRGIADAYQVGQGATAHLLPISPGIGGIVYQVLGTRSPLAEFVLASWSIGLAMATYLLLFRAFGRLGTPSMVRFVALAFACLAPAYIGQEAVDFRVWEGGLATSLGALFLDRLLAAAALPMPTVRVTVPLALIGALLLFVNPMVGLAAGMAAAIFALRRLTLRQIMLPATIGAVALFAMITPWTIRNQRAVGAAIPLRSNAGLELALANYPGATSQGDRKTQFLNRLYAIHPATGNFNRMRASGGEVAYSRQLGNAAQEWIRDHPGQAAQLMVRHVRQTIAPEQWQFEVFGQPLSSALRTAITDAVGVLGAAGLVIALVQRRWGWIYPTASTMVLLIVSSPFQPVTRYTYLLYPLMVFCAADCLATIASALIAKRSRRAG